jgi:predicted RecA/RadA family phage recombinase
MSAITKSGNPSPSTPAPPTNCSFTGKAGEDIACGDLCYIKSDGLIWRSINSGASAASSKVVGMAPMQAKAGRGCTIMWNVIFAYAAVTTFTPGQLLYLSGSAAGGLDTAVTGAGHLVAIAVDDTQILVVQDLAGA